MLVGVHILLQFPQTHQVVIITKHIVRPAGAAGVHPNTLGQNLAVHRQFRLRVVRADTDVAVVFQKQAIVHGVV